MQAILYVGHGSRLRAGVDAASEFIESAKTGGKFIEEICFLELAHPTIKEGVATCIQKGASDIAIVPLLLLSAGHAKKDIPNQIKQCQEKYPQVTFTYGKPFGMDEKIVDALHDRILEQAIPHKKEAEVLLVGRGSSDPEVKHELTAIATRLKEKFSLQTVNICFLYGATPRFEEVLFQYEQSPPKQLFIIPYLLFTGILMKTMTKKINHLEMKHVILCDSLGYHPNLQQVLKERVEKLLLLEETIKG